MKHCTTIGIDLGDKKHQVCILDRNGGELESSRISNTPEAIEKCLAGYPGAVVSMEAGTHSPWVSRLIEKMGHKVYVANPRKTRLICDTDDKTDVRDARMLAKIARFDVSMLYPIKHRGEEAHRDLALIKSREALVRARTALINHVRGAVKSLGQRLPSGWGADAFGKKAMLGMSDEMLRIFEPVLHTLCEMTENIKAYEKEVKRLAREKYGETERLEQVKGVGVMTALAYVLTLEDPARFRKSRDVGPYLGLVPKRSQSGEMNKQLHITKAGDRYLRKLLVNCAHYVMGRYGGDSGLRRHGEKISARGGRNAKNRAVVAVARKLGVLLHKLWVSGEQYDPFYNARRTVKETA